MLILFFFGLSHCADVGNVAQVSDVHSASIFSKFVSVCVYSIGLGKGCGEAKAARVGTGPDKVPNPAVSPSPSPHPFQNTVIYIHRDSPTLCTLTLKMESACASKTSATLLTSTQCDSPQNQREHIKFLSDMSKDSNHSFGYVSEVGIMNQTKSNPKQRY
jgi:hypothetical protein